MSQLDALVISINNDIDDMIGQLDLIQHRAIQVTQYLTPVKNRVSSSVPSFPRRNQNLASIMNSASLFDKLHFRTRTSGLRLLQNGQPIQKLGQGALKILQNQKTVTTPTFPDNYK